MYDVRYHLNTNMKLNFVTEGFQGLTPFLQDTEKFVLSII